MNLCCNLYLTGRDQQVLEPSVPSFGAPSLFLSPSVHPPLLLPATPGDLSTDVLPENSFLPRPSTSDTPLPPPLLPGESGKWRELIVGHLMGATQLIGYVRHVRSQHVILEVFLQTCGNCVCGFKWDEGDWYLFV